MRKVILVESTMLSHLPKFKEQVKEVVPDCEIYEIYFDLFMDIFPQGGDVDKILKRNNLWDFSYDNVITAYGSVEFLEEVERSLSDELRPLVNYFFFGHNRNYSVSSFTSDVPSERLFNPDFRFMPLNVLKKDARNYLNGLMSPRIRNIPKGSLTEASMFIRSNSSNKGFAGRVVPLDEIESLEKTIGSTINDHTLLAIASPKHVHIEYRVFLSKDKGIISFCQSHTNGKLNLVEVEELPFNSMVEEIIQYIPDEFVVCDFSHDGKLIEINPVSSSDFYLCDAGKIMEEVFRVYEKESKYE